MPNSLKSKLSKLRYKGKITEDEYNELLKKLVGHDHELHVRVCGKWITFQYAKSKYFDWRCSNCNKLVFNSRDRKYKYCPYCGSYNTCDDTSREEGDRE